ncbi:hypothetical protein SR1949_01780 [Sphaerospermopsis reniformis]|uniref:Uncharacterized protein n=1 Tax=Sphaerospermopsis reniformis TaxID=531300 RepID=A0A479ZTW5_9CYAN|nr:hypothetical protein SR1949_01780 [Sphaerospermopsis reniformis]
MYEDVGKELSHNLQSVDKNLLTLIETAVYLSDEL